MNNINVTMIKEKKNKRSLILKEIFSSVNNISYSTNALSINTTTSDTPDNDLLFILPEPASANVIKFINSAKKTLDLYLYQLVHTDIENALLNKANEDVVIRIIIPWQSTKNFQLPSNLNNLQKSNNKITIRASSVTFYNSHCKYMIADNKKAMIMDFNFDNTYFTYIRGFGLITENKNDIQDLINVFNNDFVYINESSQSMVSFKYNSQRLVWCPNSLVYREADPVHHPSNKNGLMKIYDFIEESTRTLDIYSFVLKDETIIDKLKHAAKSKNVKIRIIFNVTINSSFSLTQLNDMISSGINFKYYFYNNDFNSEESSPNYFMHSKGIISDNSKVYIGSTNMNPVSLYGNRELGIIINDKSIVDTVSKIFQKDWESSYAKDIQYKDGNIVNPFSNTNINQ